MIAFLVRTIVGVVLGSAAATAVNHWLARVGARLSRALAVLAYWLAAYVLWTFVGGLAVHYGVLAAYDGAFFGLLALVAGFVHYRILVRVGYQPAMVIFVGGQLVWLVIVLARNGIIAF